jgi:hypothetical protein
MVLILKLIKYLVKLISKLLLTLQERTMDLVPLMIKAL